LEEEGCEGVPEIVRAVVRRQSRRLEDAFERGSDTARAEWRPERRAEDPRGHAYPAALERLGGSGGVQILQCRGELLAHIDGASVPGLRRLEAVFREGTGNPDLARREVQIIPLQREPLSEPEAGADEREEERIEAARRLPRCR